MKSFKALTSKEGTCRHFERTADAPNSPCRGWRHCKICLGALTLLDYESTIPGKKRNARD